MPYGSRKPALLDEHLAAEWKRAIRTQSQLSLLMIDADDFRRYNDSMATWRGMRC
ncbi:diguanylate cyclase [Mesorhizobium sp. M0012]